MNKTRHLRQLLPGEVVFRRVPDKARPAKHLLGEPSTGPYVVAGQSSYNSVRLRDPATGQSVDGGADIPLEQILAGPKREALKFEPSEDRRIDQMVAGEQVEGLPPNVKATGWKPGKKKGWQGLVNS